MEHPFTLYLTILKAQNIPIGDFRTSDPFIQIKIGNNIVCKTSIKRFTLTPEWNEEFQIPLSHLYHLIILELWDDDVRSAKMLGKLEVKIENLPLDTQPITFEARIQKGETNIEPRGTLFYSGLVKTRPMIFKLIVNKKSNYNLPSNFLSLLSNEYSEVLISPTIQEVLNDSILISNNNNKNNSMNWSILRDLLYDVKQLKTNNINSNDLEILPIKNKKIEHTTKFSYAIKYNLFSNTSEIMTPQYRNSFTLQTNTDKYMFVASNKYLMWTWIKTIKKFYLRYLQNNKEIISSNSVERRNTSTALTLLYQYHHQVDGLLFHEYQQNDNERYYEGILTLHSIGLSNIVCKCILDSQTMILSCQDKILTNEPPIQLSLVNLHSIHISRDFSFHQPYDLKLTIVSARISVTALADSLKRVENGLNEFKLKKSTVENDKEKEELENNNNTQGWHPGRIVIEGTKLTTKVVKTVVLGTLDGTTTIVKGTAELTTSAVEGLVSIPIAAVGISLQKEEITTKCVINSPFIPSIYTSPIVGIAPYWDTPNIFKINKQILQESNSFGVMEGPCGIILHLLSKNKNNQNDCFLGSKFIPYTQIIPKDSLTFVDDETIKTKGGIESSIFESTFTLDNDIAFKIDVIRARNLLPPPSSNTINTLITHPLDSFVKLSTLATSSIGLTNPIDEKTDRQPRVSCSFINWKGLPVSNSRIYRSKTVYNTLNPNWEHTFIMTIADGLHEASYIQLIIKDDARSGEDHLMGAVYIPKEEFYTAAAVKGELIKRTYSIIGVEGMSPHHMYTNLGEIDINLQLLTKNIESLDITNKTYMAPEVTIKTQVLPSNEYTTSWLCDCVTDFQINKNVDDSLIETERFHISLGYYGLILESFDRKQDESIEKKNETHSLIESTMHQFQKKTKDIQEAGWDGTPPQIIETIEYHIFQNQKRSYGIWSSNFLNSDERGEFTDESGTINCPFTPYDTGIDPPDGFIWEPEYQNKWLIDREYTATDEDGWSYGLDFGWIMTNYREGKSATSAGLRSCRRRRWKRVAKKISILPVSTINITPTERDTFFLESLKGSDGFDIDNDNDEDIDDNNDDIDDNDIIIINNNNNNSSNSLLQSSSSSHEIKTFEIFENQRRSVTFDWGRENLFRAERAPFSDETGEITYHYDSINSNNEPPPGYEWIEDDWKIDTIYTNTDEAGWVYGIDFTWIMSNLKKGRSTTSGTGRSVRRRKYTRLMKKINKSITNMPNNISINAPRKSVKNLGAINSNNNDNDNDIVNGNNDNNNKSSNSNNNRKSVRMSRKKQLKNIKSKLEMYNINKDLIVSLCKERQSMTSTINIPWNQVLSCDVISPSVIMLTTQVNRYFGEDSMKNETYRLAEVQIFIVDCPAERISKLIFDRKKNVECRENIICLINSGSMTGEIITSNNNNINNNDNNTDNNAYYMNNSYSEVVDEDNNLRIVAQELSLGSSTNLYIDKEITHLTHTIEDIKKYEKICLSTSSNSLITTNTDLTSSSSSVISSSILPIFLYLSNPTDIPVRLTNEQFHEMLQDEIKHLELIKLRYLLYITSLLEASLIGPKFDEEYLKQTIRSDYKVAEKLYRNICEEQPNEIDAAKQMIDFLLDIAEMRIRDTALCGWSHRGEILEKCLELLINGYYTHIVGVLGRFFESKEGLMSLKSNESKLKLIQFFMQNNSHLNELVQSSIRSYHMIVEPAPLLSLCLDVNSLISWYADILIEEMKKYVQNIFLANYKQQLEKKVTYTIPWDVVISNNLYISSLPADTILILTNYLQLVRIKSSSLPLEMQNHLKYLDEKIRIGYMESFIVLATEYRNILSNHDWTLPFQLTEKQFSSTSIPSSSSSTTTTIPTTTTISQSITFSTLQLFQLQLQLQPKEISYTEEEINSSLSLHIEWLSSVANDCQFILDEYMNKCLEISFDSIDDNFENNNNNSNNNNTNRRGSITMSTQNVVELNDKMQILKNLLRSIINGSMDALSCIMLKSITEFLPTENIFEKWKLHLTNSTELNYVKEFINALDSYLEEDFICFNNNYKSTIKFECLIKLIEICLNKVIIWYLTLLREFSVYICNHEYEDEYLAQIKQDCILITEYFESKLIHINMIFSNVINNSNKTSLINNKLKIFIYLNNLLNEELGSKLFTESCLNLIEVTTVNKSYSYSYKQLFLMVFKIREEIIKKTKQHTETVNFQQLKNGMIYLLEENIKQYNQNQNQQQNQQNLQQQQQQQQQSSTLQIIQQKIGPEVEPEPEIIVFQLQLNVKKYLTKSFLNRIKYENKVLENNMKLTQEKPNESKIASFFSKTNQLFTFHSNSNSNSNQNLNSSSLTTTLSNNINNTDNDNNNNNNNNNNSTTNTITNGNEEKGSLRVKFFNSFHLFDDKQNVVQLYFQKIVVNNLFPMEGSVSVFITIQLNEKSIRLNPVNLQQDHLNLSYNNLNKLEKMTLNPKGDNILNFIVNCRYNRTFNLNNSLKIGSYKINLNEYLESNIKYIEINNESIECSNEVGTSKEILKIIQDNNYDEQDFPDFSCKIEILMEEHQQQKEEESG